MNHLQGNEVENAESNGRYGQPRIVEVIHTSKEVDLSVVRN